MKKILCFGDSNTYGFIPGSGKRYDPNTRWTGILKKIGAGKFEVIEAGCNNRTAFIDNPAGKMQTGYKILPELLQKELDCVILAIGINDLQFFFNPSLDEVKNGIKNLIRIVREKCPDASIILASPAKLTNDLLNGFFACQFNKSSIEKSLQLGTIYKAAAEETGCHFIDLDKITEVSPLDGLHFSPEAHAKIAHAIFEMLSDF